MVCITMQYQVPQFIEVESKIVGPLTLKQFFYLAAAFLLCFILFFLFQFWLWLIFAIIVGGSAVAFAFVKINGRSFAVFVKSVLFYFWRPRFYLWQKTASPPTQELSSLELKLKTSSQPIGKRERGFGFSIFSGLRPRGELFEIFRKATGEREVARRVDYR